MIDNHIEILTKKAEGIENRLCETKEILTADKLMSLLKELGETINALQYLMNIKKVREQDKMIKPVNNKLSLIN